LFIFLQQFVLIRSSTVASKCGVAVFEDGEVTNSASHIKAYMDGTIERLGFTPDLYYLHRIDPSMYTKWFRLPFAEKPAYQQKDTPLEESIPALELLRKEGKTKYIGLSECSAKTLRKANSSRA
jgi:aryl-alcohol dehydrogenase-like predicted oxidoreductase